jgi:hypothetical protein
MDQHVALAAWETTSTHADVYCSTNTLDPLTEDAVGCADIPDETSFDTLSKQIILRSCSTLQFWEI